jgi:pimeloyl-ACP methyl ester carboxylesterase
MARADVEAGDDSRPHLPPGRVVWLPGRGRTFVREMPGPAGAPTIILLHGWTATADLNWVRCYEDLGARFHVVALDHRGHGRGLRGTHPFRLDDCADDVAALAGELGIERFVAVGYSMGGSIAQLLWRRHPHLIDGLVLCATSCVFRGRPREHVLFSIASGASAVAAAMPMRPITAAALGAVAGWQNLRGRRWWGFDDIARHDWIQIIEAGRELGRFDSRAWIAEVDVPTAVVVTHNDEIVPARRQLALAAAIAGAQVFDADGGHDYCTLPSGVFAGQLVAACSAVTRSVATNIAA